MGNSIVSGICGDSEESLPTVSECVQYTVLVWIPAAFFWLLFPLFWIQARRIRAYRESTGHRFFAPIPASPLLWFKQAIPLGLCFDSMLVFFINLFAAKQGYDSHLSYSLRLLYPLVRGATMLGCLLALRTAKHSGMVSSGVIHTTFLVHTVCALPEMYSWYLMAISSEATRGAISRDANAITLMASLLWFAGLAAESVLLAFADTRCEEERTKYLSAPELHCSFLNRMLLWWFNPLPRLGARKSLDVDDLFELNHRMTSDYLVPLWEHYWTPTMEDYMERKRRLLAEGIKKALLTEQSKEMNGAAFELKGKRAGLQYNRAGHTEGVKPPSIAYNLFKMFKCEFSVGFLVKLFADMLQFANPFILKQLIGYVSSPGAHLWQGVLYALSMFFISELRSFLVNFYFFIMLRLGIKVQTALTTAVYKKTLCLSNSARRSKTVGEIVNLMAIDVERIQQITHQIQQYWSSPFQIFLALLFLFNTLGLAAISGVIIMALFIPLSVFSSFFTRNWQMQQMKLKDERSKMTNEVLNGVRVIKLYAWEIYKVPMVEVIERIRRLELTCILKAGLVKCCIDVFNVSSPFLVAIASFTTFSLLDPENNLLTPQIAFVSLTLFNQVRSPMTMLGLLINQTVQVVVSNKRLKEFLVADEIDPNVVEKSPKDAGEKENFAIRIENADLSWEPMTQPVLQDIALDIRPGSLVAVVGRVGCAKSSLLSAMLGEVEKLRGRVALRGRCAYVPQSPWIQNMPLRENITFGHPFDSQLYQRVIRACALKPDIDSLPYGDATEIGEKGINLSGGQKARVALARAIYQDYDVYLLDDPLSAVDSHVGRWIFDEVIGPNGILKHKTRVLVTHGVSYLKSADQIVMMQDGKIAEVGTYAELQSKKGVFALLIDEGQLANGNDGENAVDGVATSTSHALPTATDFTLAPLQAEGGEDDGDEDDYKSELGDFPIETGTASPEMALAVYERQLSQMSQMSLSTQIARPSSTRRKHDGIMPSPSGMHSDIDASESKDQLGGNKLIQKEKVETGRVKPTVYLEYIKAASYTMSVAFFGLFCTFQALQVSRNMWLSKWADENEQVVQNTSSTQVSVGVRLGIYASFGVGEALAFFTALLALLFGGLSASRNLHSPVLFRILRAPMSFFDTTPLGRIMNRFGKDIDVIDAAITLNFRYFLMCLTQVCATLFVISFSTPIFIVVILPLAALYLLALKFYVPTSRQLKRLESSNRSPLYSHFGETIQGASTIRAFDRSEQFCDELGRRVDRVLRIKHLNLVANRWLGVRLEFVGNCVVLFAALFAALAGQWGISAGLVGLSVSYALNITEMLNFTVRQVSELETNIVSVERLKEFSEVVSEAPWRVEGANLPKNWPSHGQMEFHHYSTRYRPGLELVVQGIELKIAPGEKVGIVGRTGAGKSSFTLALFRMIESAEGRIVIDGIDIAQIGLHDLRQALTIIPQEPVLFSGTLRFNLDPFQRHDDAELWRVLEQAHLKEFVGSLPQGLAHQISEGGTNISVGQRQLVCLARALLRHSRILVLDEATAAVDLATDLFIQDTIRREFSQSTVFTIAHRLNTILDYDRVLVLDHGKVKEFDSPGVLLANPSSLFAGLAADAKIGIAKKE